MTRPMYATLWAVLLAGAAGCELVKLHPFVPCPGPTQTTWSDVAVGDAFGCAIDVDDTAWCWGSDPGLDGRTVLQLAAGPDFGCALDLDGQVGCSGADTAGQVSTAPTEPGFVDVTAGTDHACALSDSGAVSCWGADDQGQATGVPDTTFLDVHAGDGFTCGREAGTSLPICWGDAPAIDQDTPLAALTTTGAGVCGVEPEGAVVCWDSPVVADDLGEPIVALAGGADTACARSSTLDLRCSGDGEAADAPSQAVVAVSVSPDGAWGCAVTERYALTCWGDRVEGQP